MYDANMVGAKENVAHQLQTISLITTIFDLG